MKARDEILDQFISDNHQEGAVIPKKYFWGLYGLVEPKGMVDAEAHDKTNFQFMTAHNQLVKDLLEHHKLDLQSLGRKKFRLIPYQERVPVVIKDVMREIRRYSRKGEDRLVNIPHPEQLNGTHIKERDHMLSALEMTRRLMTARRRYPE